MNNPKHRSFSLGAFYTLLSAVALSMGYLIVKLASGYFPFFVLVFARFSIALVCLVIFLLVTRTLRDALRTTHLKFYLPRAIITVISQSCLFFYIAKSNILNAAVFMNTVPFFIVLLERIFMKHYIGKSTAIGIIVSGIGILIMLHPGFGIFEWIGLIGLLAGFLVAISQVIFGFTVKRETKGANIFYFLLFGTLFSLPPLFIFPIQFPTGSTEFSVPLLLFGLGAFTLLNQFFRGKAYEQGKISRIATFIYFTVPLAALFEWLFLDTIPDLYALIGGFFVILGGILKAYLRLIFIKKKEM